MSVANFSGPSSEAAVGQNGHWAALALSRDGSQSPGTIWWLSWTSTPLGLLVGVFWSPSAATSFALGHKTVSVRVII